MTIEEKSNHVEEALGNFLEQFKGKERLAQVLSIYVDQIQELEQAAFGVYLGQMLQNAEGAQLDGLGDIVGEPREGKTDAEYRISITVRILINLSEGTPEHIISIVEAATEGAYTVKYREYWPAAFVIEVIAVDDPPTFPAALLVGYVRDGKPAGVLAQLVYYGSAPFQFDTGLGYDQGRYGGVV